MENKLGITALVIVLILIGLAYALFSIVRDKGAAYNQIVMSHQDYQSRTIPYRRGNIIDRNGTYLATSEKVYNLVLNPKQIYNEPEEGEESDGYTYLDPTIDALVQTLGIDETDLRTQLEERKDRSYYVYMKKVSAEQKEAFESYESEKNEEYRKAPVDQGGKNRIAGVTFEDDYQRKYPYNELACDVIGFCLSEGHASGGVEQYYDEVLTGVNGREFGYMNDESNPERTVKQAVNGNTVQLTIDVNLQQIVEKYIDEWQSTTGSKVAACIMMDPNTGEILAMDTSVRYDLNNPYDLTSVYTQEEIDQMDETTKENAWYQMWRNFCVSDAFEPGSTQKPFTVAGAMEEGTITGNETYVCNGKLTVGDWDIRCVARSGHGALTVTQGIMKSCNVVMMEINFAQGAANFLKHQKIFGFGEKTGIDLPGEADTSGLVYTLDNIDSASLATNSFGQNYSCTMIQMAAAYCSLINGGSYYQPHVMKQVLNDTGAVVKKNDPVLVRETCSESTSTFIKNALLQTVEEGTAQAAKVEGYQIGGKTGTAQKLPRSDMNYVVSFIGCAPAMDPQVLCYVVIDTPNLPGEEQAHSIFASGIFQKIMTEALPYLNIFPEGSQTGETNEALSNLPEGVNSGESTAAETESESVVTATDENGETVTEGPDYTDEVVEEGVVYPDLELTSSAADESPQLSEEESSDTSEDDENDEQDDGNN